MEKKSVKLLIISICVIFLFPKAYATITVEPLAPVYNIGDDFSLSIKLSSQTAISDFLTVELICNELEKREVYKAFFSLKEGETKNLVLPARFSPSLLSSLKGTCKFKAYFNNEEAATPSFEITSQIISSLQIENSIISPGETLKIKGTAIKKNGKNAEGFAKISIPIIGLTTSSAIKGGAFTANLTIPLNTPAKVYEILAVAEEKDSNSLIINEGNSSTLVTIKQKPSSLDIALEKTEVKPSSELVFTPLLYDQTGELISESIIVNIFSPEGVLKEKRIASAGSAQSFYLQENSPPGYWKISLQFSNLSTKKEFSVQEVENASFFLQNNTLIIKNQGNIPFQKIIEISIGNAKEILNVAIPVAKESKYKLFAPSGEYSITIKDKETTSTLGNTFLTGKSISIKEITSKKGSWFYILLWIIVILVLIAIAAVYYKKIKPKTSWASAPEEKEIKTTRKNSSTPFILEGKSGKREVAVISINIKNSQNIENIKDTPAEKTLLEITEKVKKEGFKIYQQGSFKIILLPSKSANEPAPVLKALTLSKEIEEIINEHNKRYALKIKYGIGINKGYMLAEIKEGRISFTSIGTTVISAKNLSEYANEQIIINDEVYKSALGKIKVEKVGEKRWHLLSVINRAHYSEFINKFMNRQ